MSKSRRRLESFREVVRRKKEKAPPEPWTWKDRVSVFGSLTVVVLLVFIPFMDQRVKHNQRIDERVSRWAKAYDLNEHQIKKITNIEKAFHRHELPFSTEPKPSDDKGDLHLRDIASVMDGNRSEIFLLQERSAPPSQDH
jgi:hypothetical protein